MAAKKKLRSKIALREAAEAQADEDLTEEEKASAKMHAMKMEEQAQMSLTRDMFGKNSLLPFTCPMFFFFLQNLDPGHFG